MDNRKTAGDFMNKYILTAPCGFGLEAVVKREIMDLGFEIESVDDGKVSFYGDEKAIAKANINLRTCERILIEVAKFDAYTFDELFEKTKSIKWSKYISIDGQFPVKKASSVKSTLFSPSDIQSIVKKAIVESLKKDYKVDWFEETKEEYPIRVFIKKDQVAIYIDTSGESLHKRGYREIASQAPISETLAAAIVKLTPWRAQRPLIDPFCGSGTILIEACMNELKIAPGKNRSFISEEFSFISKDVWIEERQNAISNEIKDIEFLVEGYDIDDDVLSIARENAKIAGVEKYIHFQKRDVRNLTSSKQYGFIITNPPYGERLEDRKTVANLYSDLKEPFSKLDTWSFFIITSFEEFEQYFGRKASKKRKLYNGMLKTDLYQYFGPKPKRR